MTKYQDQIFDGRWKVTRYIRESQKYELENIYNHKKIEVHHNQMTKVANGKDTISHIITRYLCKIKKESSCIVDNSVANSYHRQISKYRKG